MSRDLDDALLRLRARVVTQYLEQRIGSVDARTVRKALARQGMEPVYVTLLVQLETTAHRWYAAIRRLWAG